MDPATASTFVVPEVVISHFHIKPGDTVADFGAGPGHFLKSLAARVGPEGKIYACEIQRPLVEAIGETARALGIHTLQPLWCDLEEPGGIRIEEGTVDVGLLINTLFQLEAKEAALAEMLRVIKKGGRLIVIDWSDSYHGMGPQRDHVVPAHTAVAMLEANHTVFESEFPAGAHHYGISMRKI